MELISDEGEFKESNFKEFIILYEYGPSYAVVGTMGPQNIGKSTLLNRLFDTNFKEWNDESMKCGEQTTKGVWIAKAVREKFPLVIMDIEGTDGHERGEVIQENIWEARDSSLSRSSHFNPDENMDVTFEIQSALFTLLFVHILLINIHTKDIGKEHGANRRLLRTMFQAALAMPSFNPRKTTLFFVIRDTTPFGERTRESVIDRQKKNVDEIWEAVQKPEGHENAPLDDFFTVEFYSLPLYHNNEEQFKEEVGKLGREISNLISGELLDSGFFEDAKNVWETIKQNEDLNIPSLKVMVATLQCDRTVRKILRDFETDDQDWFAVREAVETQFVPDFGATLTYILSKYLSQYDSTLIHCESEDIRNEIRQDLEASILSVVHPAYMKNIRHLRSEQLENFITQLEAVLINGGEGGSSTQSDDLKKCCVLEFDRCLGAATPDQATWEDNASTERQQLLCDIQLHITNKLSQIVKQCQNQLSNSLNGELSRLFRGEEITWSSVNELLRSEVIYAMNDFSIVGAVFQPEIEIKREDFKQHARKVVERKFKDEIDTIQILMKTRYNLIYAQETGRYELSSDNSNEARERFSRATEEAYRECLKLLSTMAVIRLDETYDVVERMLFSELMPDANNGVQISEIALDSSTWPEEVPPEVTLITPSECRYIWGQFKREMETITPSDERILQLMRVSESEYSWTPPHWVTSGLLSIGASGLLRLLRFSNLDLIALASMGSTGITLASMAGIAGELIMNLLRDLRELLTRNVNEAINIFRRQHARIMSSLMEALRSMLENIVIGRRSTSLMLA